MRNEGQFARAKRSEISLLIKVLVDEGMECHSGLAPRLNSLNFNVAIHFILH